jgi:hypothetical protein
MKKYIKSSESSSGKYIGGKLRDLPEDYWDDEDAHVERFETQDNFIRNYTDNFIVYRPNSEYYKFELMQNYPGLLSDLCETMAIKDGVDVCDMGNYIKLISYYNRHQDIICLYPISTEKADELSNIIDNADFEESEVIDNEIAQYAWDGGSITDILESWA